MKNIFYLNRVSDRISKSSMFLMRFKSHKHLEKTHITKRMKMCLIVCVAQYVPCVSCIFDFNNSHSLWICPLIENAFFSSVWQFCVLLSWCFTECDLCRAAIQSNWNLILSIEINEVQKKWQSTWRYVDECKCARWAHDDKYMPKPIKR